MFCGVDEAPACPSEGVCVAHDTTVIDRVYAEVLARNPGEGEFHQAVH